MRSFIHSSLLLLLLPPCKHAAKDIKASASSRPLKQVLVLSWRKWWDAHNCSSWQRVAIQHASSVWFFFIVILYDVVSGNKPI